MNIDEARKTVRKAIKEKVALLDLCDPSGNGEKLTSTHLQELMPEIKQIKDLRELKLDGNQIDDISALTGLNGLRELSLYNNQITDITVLTELGSLQRLDLTSNQVNDLSPIGNLENLRSLFLMSNRITSISGIANLKGLETLTLSDNRIRDLNFIIDLCELRVLWLEANELTDITTISRLTKLTTLLLYRNQIRDISPLFDLKSLVTLSVDQNPAIEEKIPAEIRVQNDAQRILNYWLSITHGSRPLNEAKIVVIGEADIGKTFLINKLVYDKIENTESTHGIQIHRWKNVEVNEEKVQMNVWDFGGQEMMHSTHEFFFTERTVYILVLDARKNEDSNKTAEWLNRIKSLAGDSPIMIVGNQIDQNKRNPDQPGIGYLDINRRGILDKHPNVKGFFPLCCDDRKVPRDEEKAEYSTLFAEFKEALVREIGLLDEIHKPFPANWFRIRDELQDMQKNGTPYMEYGEYITRCIKAEVEDKISQETIVDFLNKVGTVIYFKETDKDTMVFNPEWITQGVYSIVDSPFLKERNGNLRREHLRNLLDKEKYPPEKYAFIINMMRRFELCVDIEWDNVFLVPDLLSSSQPEEIKTEDWKGTMGFQYHYDTYLPSIMTSFIVKMYGYQEGRKYWKNGIVLKYQDSIALVIAERTEKKVRISIKGNNLRDNQYLLSAIRKELKEIHGRFAELQVTEMVPHPEYPEIIRDYADLIFAEEIGDEFMPIKELNRKVPIKEFLDGIIPAKVRSDEAKTKRGETHIHFHGDRNTAVVGLENSSVDIDTRDFESN